MKCPKCNQELVIQTATKINCKNCRILTVLTSIVTVQCEKCKAIFQLPIQENRVLSISNSNK